jgi:hypothetical protein
VVLVLGVLEQLLLLTRATNGVHRTLRGGHGPSGNVGNSGRRTRHRVGSGQVHFLSLAAELLDARLELPPVVLRLLQVLLETLLVRRQVRHLDVRGKRLLQLLLLAVRLVEVLNQLRVTGVDIGH